MATLTTRGTLPVLPAESRALAMTVVEPSPDFVVSHGIEIGPEDVSFVLLTTAPFTLSEYVLLPAAAFSTHSTNHVVPRTVAPSAPGCVTATRSVPPAATVTLRVAVALRPAPSCTVRRNVWAPAGTPLVSQLNEAVEAVPEVVKIGVVPLSRRTAHVMVPVPPVSFMPTDTAPLTVVPSPGVVNDALKGPAMTMLRVAVAVWLAPSCTVRFSVWAPAGTALVSQLNEAVEPVPEVVKIGLPPLSRRSVQLMVPVKPLSLIPTVTVPLTVEPSAGLVIDALGVVSPILRLI